MSTHTQGFNSWLRRGLSVSFLALIAACGTSTPPTSNAKTDYLINLTINAQDSQASLESKYGGKVIMWQPDEGIAILQISPEAKAALSTRGITIQGTLSSNSTVASPETASAGGWDAWAGGWNAWAGGWNAWAGGWNAWAGGWNAWAGGTGSYMPEIPGNGSGAFNQVSLQKAHMYTRNFGTGIKVAVIDTGLDLSHPAFSGRLAPSTQWRDFVDGDTTPADVSGGSYYGHGTGVAGIILQIAPRATILPIRVLGNNGLGDIANVVAGINHAMNSGVQVINLSLGTQIASDALYTAVKAANAKGIFVTASAGNYGLPDSATAPAIYSNAAGTVYWTIGVASVNSSDILSMFSSYQPAVWGMAPGENIVSAYPNSQVAKYTGTSFAAPIYAGAIALLLGDKPSTFDKSKLIDHMFLNSDYVQNLSITTRGIPNGYVNPRLNIYNVLRSMPGWTEPALPNVGVYNLININSGKCVDVNGFSSTDGAVVQQYSCNGNDNQKWRLEKAGTYYKLMAVHSGKALDVYGGGPSDGSKVVQWGFVGGNNQLWTLSKKTSDTFSLVNVNSGKCLDVNASSTADGVQLQQWTCNGNANQVFTLKPLF